MHVIDRYLTARLMQADVIAALAEPPGTGRWTAEMFLTLALGGAGLHRVTRL